MLAGALALLVGGLVMIDGILLTLGVSGLLVMVTALVAGRANLREVRVEMDAPALRPWGQSSHFTIFEPQPSRSSESALGNGSR